MLAVTRFAIPEDESDEFLADLRVALQTLETTRGFVRGHLGRAVDDPGLWLLATEWEGVGAYRRALSSYDVKVLAVPVMSRALDEPGAFEVVAATGRTQR